MICRICKTEREHKIHTVREMRLGYREPFEYMECSNCGCLQIVKAPQNLAKYYPPSYAPFRRPGVRHKRHFLYVWARQKRAEYGLTGKGILGWLIAHVKPLPPIYEHLRKCRVNFDSNILDLGCGGGQLLLTLYDDGFRKLVGVDLYAPDDAFVNAPGLKMVKGTVNDLSEPEVFDLVMMHHSFEHMPDPVDTLKKVNRLLKRGGYLLIRIPILAYAWRHYGVHWVQLDAPRHFYLHTTKSIQILCDQTGFSVEDISYDSTEFQFLGSEQYMKNISIWDKRSYWVDPKNSIFTKAQVCYFKKRAAELNRIRDGDQAAFVLKKR